MGRSLATCVSADRLTEGTGCVLSARAVVTTSFGGIRAARFAGIAGKTLLVLRVGRSSSRSGSIHCLLTATILDTSGGHNMSLKAAHQ